MNKKEFLKLSLIIIAIILTLFVLVSQAEAGIGIVILFIILAIFALPILYLYKYSEIKNNRAFKIGTILILVGLLIFIGYFISFNMTYISTTGFGMTGPDNNDNYGNISLALSYTTYDSIGSTFSYNSIFFYITLLFALLYISVDDVFKKTNKTNYILTVITSILIIATNFYHLDPMVKYIADNIYINPFDFVRQFDILFCTILLLIITHKFLNREES